MAISAAENAVYQLLTQLEIPYTRYAHAPVFTVAEADGLNLEFPEEIFKNLFIRNRKGDRHYLVILKGSKRLDLKKLGQIIGENGLNFASPERLARYLGLTPGAVSPFGLINDQPKEVIVIIDQEVSQSAMVNFHPNVNTATLTLANADWMKFLQWCGNQVRHVRI